LLGRVASSSDREHAWISEKVLREWPQLSADYLMVAEVLSNMIEAVATFAGSISQSLHPPHIEYAPYVRIVSLQSNAYSFRLMVAERSLGGECPKLSTFR